MRKMVTGLFLVFSCGFCFGGVKKAELYQKQDSLSNAMEFAGVSDNTCYDFAEKYGVLADSNQLALLNVLFEADAARDVEVGWEILSETTAKVISEKNKGVFEIALIERGEMFEDGEKYFAVSSKFSEEEYEKLERVIDFSERPSHRFIVMRFDREMQMLKGGAVYAIQTEDVYRMVCPVFSQDVIEEQLKGKNAREQKKKPEGYGIIAFKKQGEGIWRYNWDIRLSEENAGKYSYEVVTESKVVKGEAEIDDEFGFNEIIKDSELKKKWVVGDLEFRLHIPQNEPAVNNWTDGRSLSLWSVGLSGPGYGISKGFTIHGKNVSNIKVNEKGDFSVEDELELMSFETRDGDVVYQTKLFLSRREKSE